MNVWTNLSVSNHVPFHSWSFVSIMSIYNSHYLLLTYNAYVSVSNYASSNPQQRIRFGAAAVSFFLRDHIHVSFGLPLHYNIFELSLWNFQICTGPWSSNFYKNRVFWHDGINNIDGIHILNQICILHVQLCRKIDSLWILSGKTLHMQRELYLRKAKPCVRMEAYKGCTGTITVSVRSHFITALCLCDM